MKNNIASERVRLDLSQDDLANELNISRETVKKWETGETPIKSSMLIAMSDLFNCSIDYLLGRSNERTYMRAS